MTNLSDLFPAVSVQGADYNIPLLLTFPTGSSGAFTIDADSFLITASGVSYSDLTDCSVSTDGYVTFNAAYTNFAVGLPAISGTYRKYTMTFRGPASGAGSQAGFRFNIQDSLNYWVLTILTSGTNYKVELFEVVSGTPTGKGSIQPAGSFGDDLTLVVYEYGDRVSWAIIPADSAGIASGVQTYTVASRSYKSEAECSIGNWGSTNFEWKSLLVEDID